MTGWHPLRIRGGLLAVGRAVFAPGGLALDGRTLPWDGVGGGPVHADIERWPGAPAEGWAFDLLVHGYWFQAPMLSVGFHTGTPPFFDLPDDNDIPLGPLPLFFERRVTAANALASYLRDEPRARAALADPARVAVLLAALRAMPRRTRLPRQPLMGDVYDLHWALVRAYRRTHPRRYDDRRVDADPAPTAAAVVAAAALPARLTERFPAAAIEDRARAYVTLPPWPFGLLL